MTLVSVIPGNSAIVLAQPHSGAIVPPDVYARLNETGRTLKDTDWHIPALYRALLPEATIVKAEFNRYVIDPNRDPGGGSDFGQNTTELVPTSTFDGDAIWNELPSARDIAKRIELYHEPYHASIREQIRRVRDMHGYAVLYDCHSIRSSIPNLFNGRLPDLNIGTNSGASCASSLLDAVRKVCRQQDTYSHVADGRFKGGWTTRHYGNPKVGIHAIQMELSQRTYLKSETPPFKSDSERSAKLRIVLGDILSSIEQTAKLIKKPETIGGT